MCMTPLQVQNFMRCVQHVALEPVACCCPGMTVLALHIKGTAFLWHQVGTGLIKSGKGGGGGAQGVAERL